MSLEVSSLGERIVQAFREQQMMDDRARVQEALNRTEYIARREVTRKDIAPAVSYVESFYRDFTDAALCQAEELAHQKLLHDQEISRGRQRFMANLLRPLSTEKKFSIASGFFMFNVGVHHNIESGIAYACLAVGISTIGAWAIRRLEGDKTRNTNQNS